MDDDLHPLVKAIVAVSAIGSGLVASVVTVVAVRGATVPVLGWETDGGAVPGMFAMMVGFSLITMIGYWMGMLVGMPLQRFLERRRKRG